jgi:tetratricopeptide (TPR) repeat protein
MSQRVGSRFVLAALAAVLVGAGFGAGVPLAGADMLQTTDGKWFPPTEPVVEANDEPGDDLLVQSQDHRADATYETVKLVGSKGTSKPAGQVVKVLSSARATVPEFRKARSDAEGSFWPEAAEGFAAAAEVAQGFGKQDALWMRVQALAEGQMVAEMNAAIDDLLTAFPKSYFFGEAHILRARVAVSQGKVADATKFLEAVKAAPGMNLRDAFRAEYMRVYLTLDAQRKVDESLAGYQKLVEWIDKSDATLGETTRLQALVGIGNAHVTKGNVKDATAAFTKATESKNPDVLAGAYTGLGDVAFGEARQLRDAKDLEGAKKKLETAAQHYLRVTQFYRASVTEIDSVLRALGNQAKVFTALFDMARDIESGRRAFDSYKALHDALGDGPARKQVLRDFQDFDKRYKEVQAAAKKAPPPAPPAKEPPPAEKPK